MGSPVCTELQMQLIKGGLYVEDIHMHWHIEGRTVAPPLTPPSRESLTDNWGQLIWQYETWSAHQQESSQQILLQLLQTPSALINNPVVQRTRGRPVGSRNRNEISTRWDPSTFERIAS